MKKADSVGALGPGSSSRAHMTNGSSTYDTATSGLPSYGTTPYLSPSYGAEAGSPASYETGAFGPISYGPSKAEDIIGLSDASWCTGSFHLNNVNNVNEQPPFRRNLSTSRAVNRTLNHVVIKPAAALENGYSHLADPYRVLPVVIGDGEQSTVRSWSASANRSTKRPPSRSRLAIKFVGGELSSSSGLKDHTSDGSRPRTSSSSRNASVDTVPSFEELSSEHFPYTLSAAGAVDSAPVGLNGGSATVHRSADPRSGRYTSMNHRRHHRGGSSTRSSSSSTSTSSYDRGIYLLDDHNLGYFNYHNLGYLNLL